MTPETVMPPLLKYLAGNLGVGADGRNGLGQVLKQQAHGYGRDERGHVGALLADGAVGYELDRHAHQGADHKAKYDRSPGRQARCGEYGHGEDQRVAADHDEVAVREVYQSDDAVYHRVAERDERIDASQSQSHE